MRDTILHSSEHTALSVAGGTTKLRFDNISMMKPTLCLSGMVLKPFQSVVVHGATRCHMQLSSPETLPHLSRCAESCLRCVRDGGSGTDTNTI